MWPDPAGPPGRGLRGEGRAGGLRTARRRHADDARRSGRRAGDGRRERRRAARGGGRVRGSGVRRPARGRERALRGRARRADHAGRWRRPAPGVPRPHSPGRARRAREQGLLSMAFAPDYRRSGRFYVDYTNTDGDTRVVEYRRSKGDETIADPGSAQVILRVQQPFANHNGGLVMFGPDRSLYVGLGDGGSAERPGAKRPGSRHPAGQDPANRPASGRLSRPAAQPVRRPRRGAARDPRLRASQPLAVLVRPGNRRALDRRRRPERTGGDRLPGRGRARVGRELRLVCLRGDRPLQRRPGGAGRNRARAHLRP